MNKTLVIISLFLASANAVASVDYVTVKECRSFFFGKQMEADTQDKINQELKEKLTESKALKVDFIQYGNEQSFFRNDKNSCIIATAWFDK